MKRGNSNEKTEGTNALMLRCHLSSSNFLSSFIPFVSPSFQTISASRPFIQFLDPTIPPTKPPFRFNLPPDTMQGISMLLIGKTQSEKEPFDKENISPKSRNALTEALRRYLQKKVPGDVELVAPGYLRLLISGLIDSGITMLLHLMHPFLAVLYDILKANVTPDGTLGMWIMGLTYIHDQPSPNQPHKASQSKADAAPVDKQHISRGVTHAGPIAQSAALSPPHFRRASPLRRLLHSALEFALTFSAQQAGMALFGGPVAPSGCSSSGGDEGDAAEMDGDETRSFLSSVLESPTSSPTSSLPPPGRLVHTLHDWLYELSPRLADFVEVDGAYLGTAFLGLVDLGWYCARRDHKSFMDWASGTRVVYQKPKA
eukprot:gnl/Trimastix_PCT/3971.p1 GENE.gnl/Trimastix_PCT/3971~~gnl/Trimastix_PCT/3971.p1  ORF type:complete len:372 (+),score=52.96 gnl/Trimastix_PCT/3971:2-1117(+)